MIIGESASAGLLDAGGVHLVKSAVVRPAESVTTGGVANIPISIAESILATILSILAIIIPVAVAALIVLVTAFAIWLPWRRARRAVEAQGRKARKGSLAEPNPMGEVVPCALPDACVQG